MSAVGWVGLGHGQRQPPLDAADRGFGMGVGGSGFAVVRDTLREDGMSEHSATFDNPGLASGNHFQCVNFEVLELSSSLAAGRGR